MKKLLLLLFAFFLCIYSSQAQCGPGQDTTPPVFGNPGDGTMANPFRNLLQTTVGGVASGTYYFNFNGNTFQGVLDNDTDGGGWLMILNYVHVAGDSSNLTIRNTDLPLLGSSTLTDNEAGTANWGHMGNALAAAIDFEEIRFYGVTTGHNRVIDFKTNYSNGLNYVKTGTGTFSGINNSPNHTVLPNHSANIPAQALNSFINQGDLALTNFPFWRSSQYHWGIKGSGDRWEVDDFAINTQSTIHRAWVRGDLSPVATTTLSVNLDVTGNLTIAPGDFGLTATDNCTTPSLSLSRTSFDCSDLGNNTIQLIATDDQNNSTSIDVTVIIVDSAPVITTDNFAFVNLDATGNASITLADLNASATDDCGLQSLTLDQTDFDCTNASRTVTVTLTATDLNGNVSTSQVRVAINDTMIPVVACVAPFAVELEGNGTVTISADDLLLSATDNCSSDLRPFIDKSTFTCADLGDNIVTLTVRDAGGRSATCSTTVTITAPSCPSDFVLESDADACGAVYNYPCASNITSGPPSGTLLAIGSTTTFTYDTLDNTGGTVSCSYDVTVVDTRAPIFNTKDHTVTLNANETATILPTDLVGEDPLARDYTVDTAGTLDRIDISTTGTQVTLGDDEVSTALPIGFEFGFYGNRYTEFYISSNGFITFTANSDDGCCNGQTLPDTSEPNNLIAFDWNDIDPDDGGIMRYTTIGTAPNRTLIMDWDSVTHIDDSNDITTTQVKLFEGTNRIEIHTTNIPLTSDDKTQGLENIDGTAAIIVPGRNAANWGATNDYVAFVPTSTTFDNCGIDTMEVSPNTFDCSNKGDNTVTLTITDVNGNSASKTAIVRIETLDITAPVISLTGADPQTIEFGAGYTELGATTDDGSTVIIDSSDFSDAVGSYTIRYNAADDSCNNAIEVTRTVNVVDTTAPIITLTGDNPQTIERTNAYTELGASTDDGSTVVINTSAININTVGSYTVTYNATDASGNTAIQVTRTVNVVDTTAPVIMLLGDNPQTIELGAGYTELGATTDDGTTIAIDSSNFMDTVGSYTIRYNATDPSGNTATEVTRTVNVIDTTAPMITLLGDNPQTIELGADYTELGATTDDGTTIVIDSSNFMNTVGSYTIRYNATDASGNTAIEVARTVNVVDTTAPVITLLGNNPQTIELGAGYTELGATTDDGTTVVIDSSNFMDTVGSYTIRYSATDPSENTAIEVARTVNVVDTTAPVITLLGDNPQEIELGEGYTEQGATTDDGSIVVIDASDFVDAVGSYIIRYNATDASGNTAIEVTRVLIVTPCLIDTLPENNFNILASSETCPGKNNGIITINSLETREYIATIDNQTYSFRSNLVVTDLAPGTYPVCISIEGASGCELCFELVIQEGTIMTGKTSVNDIAFKKQVFVEIEAGTAPFIVMVNNQIVGEYDTKSFIVDVKNGDKIEVTSSLVCEGKLVTKVKGLFENISLYPNPTRANTTLTLPQTEKSTIVIDIHNALGMVVSSREYNINNSQVTLLMESLSPGVYFVRINEGTVKTFKIIKE